MPMKFAIILSLLLYGGAVNALGGEMRPSVLAIGIDGIRPDALAEANTPHLDRLIREGAYCVDTQILGKRYSKNDTISGPGWSSILTGVWADKHGVQDNSFEGKNYTEFPHFFVRLKEASPDVKTASFVDWAPIEAHVVAGADLHRVIAAEGADGYSEADEKLSDEAAEHIDQETPDATFVYFGQVDETGHAFGFHPSVKEYVAAIERVDRLIGKLLDAVDRHRGERDWLVLVTTDHGGEGTGHGSGHELASIRNVFMIVSGAAAKTGRWEQPTYLVDFPVTALAHMEVELRDEWKLDGRPVGLKRPTK